MMRGFRFRYVCSCGEHEVVCRWRGEHESIERFLEDAVRPAMSRDHARRVCLKTSADLKLPMSPGARGIGYPVLQ